MSEEFNDAMDRIMRSVFAGKTYDPAAKPPLVERLRLRLQEETRDRDKRNERIAILNRLIALIESDDKLAEYVALMEGL